MSVGTENLHVIGRWIEDRARQTPRRSAIEFDGDTMTYGELDATSSQLARALLHFGLAPVIAWRPSPRIVPSTSRCSSPVRRPV